MLIKREVLEAIRRGDIDLQFRRWSRPSVRAGGTLKTALGILSIGRMDEVDPASVTDEEARRAGLGDRAGFLRWLGTMKQGPLFHRIEVSFPDKEAIAPGSSTWPVAAMKSRAGREE